MKKRIRYIFPSNGPLIPSQKALDGTGVSVSSTTLMHTGKAPFETVVEYDTSSVTQKGLDILQAWQAQASSIQDLPA